MAYSKKVATCVIGNDGKIYDEDPKGMIVVPFDTEFKVRVINKNDRKIGFDLFIDGKKVTKTGRIIVNPHDRVDLERWVEDDSKGTKFRFVPKDSQEAKMEGKDKEPYTGLVEVRVYFEKERPVVKEIHHHHDHYYEDHHHHHHDDWWPRRQPWDIWYCTTTNAVGGFFGSAGHRGISGYSGYSGNGSTGYSGSAGNASFTSSSSSASLFNMDAKCSNLNSINYCSSVPLEEGAIVRGSKSNQSFYSTYVELEDDYVSLKMYIMGYHNVEVRMEEVDRTEKQTEFEFMKDFCTKCGNLLKAGDNFCGKCGGKR